MLNITTALYQSTRLLLELRGRKKNILFFQEKAQMSITDEKIIENLNYKFFFRTMSFTHY